MALSIRNPLAEKLARKVAAESGENLTQAIIRSLEERLERLRGRSRVSTTTEAIMRISERCRALPDLDPRTPDAILGYDENGIPRR